MEIERTTNRAQRAHRNVQPSAKQDTPVSTRKSISVAAIFKNGAHRTKKATVTLQSNANKDPLAVDDVSGTKTQDLRSLSSSLSPQKARCKVSKKRLVVHPLAVAFKGAYSATVIACERATDILASQKLAMTIVAISTETLH
jgi:hypothetical protein